MANYHLQLTPSLVNRGTEGSMDGSVLGGISKQRTGFMDVINGGDSLRKSVQVYEGVQFNDTISTWDDATYITAL